MRPYRFPETECNPPREMLRAARGGSYVVAGIMLVITIAIGPALLPLWLAGRIVALLAGKDRS